MPLVNDRGESFQAEFELPGSPGTYFRANIFTTFDEAIRYLYEQAHSVFWDDESSR